MAATDSTLIAVKGQAFRVYGCIRSNSTGNPITGGLTTPAATISKDGAAFASSTNSLTEIGTTGKVYLDLTAAEMSADTLLISLDSGDAAAIEEIIELRTASLTELTGPWWEETVKRVEQMWAQIAAFLLQRSSRNKNSGLVTLYQQDEATAIGTYTIDNGDTTVTKSELS